MVTAVLLFLLDFVLPDTKGSHLFRQGITSLSVLPFLYSFYRQDSFWRGEPLGKKEFLLTKREAGTVFLLFLAGGCFALAWNNVLSMVHISDYSVSYNRIRETFYVGKFFMEFCVVCLLAPMAEELLYRGIVYKRAKDWLGIWPGIIVSAVMFGLVHMNLVQFVYAGVFGIFSWAFCGKNRETAQCNSRPCGGEPHIPSAGGDGTLFFYGQKFTCDGYNDGFAVFIGGGACFWGFTFFI